MQSPRCDSVIAYAPIEDEPDYSILGLPKPVFIVPPDSAADVSDELHAAKGLVRGEVCVLVPGRAFDMGGTRHGRGGGWYDRFLARAPRHWMTIGVTTPARLSETPLERQPHDIPMDYIAVIENGSVKWIKL